MLTVHQPEADYVSFHDIILGKQYYIQEMDCIFSLHEPLGRESHVVMLIGSDGVIDVISIAKFETMFKAELGFVLDDASCHPLQEIDIKVKLNYSL